VFAAGLLIGTASTQAVAIEINPLKAASGINSEIADGGIFSVGVCQIDSPSHILRVADCVFAISGVLITTALSTGAAVKATVKL
jgi:hypothetical protein